ncbi:hypothetical protein Adu01nite_56610 [Paractinoplanes durhamensis]|uniref:DUF4232 domain-containing protein n=2 Tax=Paractinoplanes durhamensis TaxID=113563 RepID=A0ABQ3Z3E3_9ACTN|nr:hypothetical protein Adu01nite_56610 [Actinoplanes durhamensis]
MAAPALLAAGCSGSPSAAPATTAPPPAASPSASSALGTAAPTGGATTSPTAKPTRTDSPVASTPRCHTGDLSVKLGGGDGAAGTQYIALVFANRSDHRCTLYGYPGVSFVAGAEGTQVGKGFTRQGGGLIKVLLAPGAVAHATISGHDVGFFDASECKPVSVRGYRVYPPDETASLFVAAPTKACSADGVNQWKVAAIAEGAAT